MSATDFFENALLQLIFNNAPIANIGDTSGLQPSPTAGELYVSLHTGDPGDAGAHSTAEATYTGYTRMTVPRNVAGWTITADTALNAAPINFPSATDGTETITHFGIGTAAAGQSSTLLFSGTLTGSLAVTAGITPTFGIGALTITAD